MERISKSTLLSLLGRQRLHWFKIEIVIEMQEVEILPMDQEVQHVVALSAHL